MATDNELLLVGMNSIGSKVDAIGVDMEYVKGEMIRNEEWHKVLNTSVQEIHEAVHGNGKPGLEDEIKCVDQSLSDVKFRLLAIEEGKVKQEKLSTVSRMEWLRGWRAVFFTGLTVLISTAITLGLGHYLSPAP